VAVVSDSFNIFQACEKYWGQELRQMVLGRNGTVVIRPDSGEPTTVVPTVLDVLGEAFGYETNEKGYRVLNPRVRIIQGDGIDFDTLGAILLAMKKRGWSGDNIAFGSGGGLLQKLNRDTLKFAFKCAAVTVNGREREVYKQPVTDHGKVSKAGRMKLVKRNGGYKTVPLTEPGEDLLVEVFRNGEVLRNWTFEEVRERAKV